MNQAVKILAMGLVLLFGAVPPAEAQFNDIAKRPSLRAQCMRLFGIPLHMDKNQKFAFADDKVINQAIADELKTGPVFWFGEATDKERTNLGLSPRSGLLTDIFFKFEGTVRKVPKKWTSFGLNREIHRALYPVLGAPISQALLPDAKVEHSGRPRLADALYAIYRFERSDRPIGFVRATMFGPKTFEGVDRTEARERDNEVLIEVFNAKLRSRTRGRFIQSEVELQDSFVVVERALPSSSSF